MEEFIIKRINELEGLKKYARDQFSLGLIDSQIKYWKEILEIYEISRGKT
jgi:hypothetical protein